MRLLLAICLLFIGISPAWAQQQRPEWKKRWDSLSDKYEEKQVELLDDLLDTSVPGKPELTSILRLAHAETPIKGKLRVCPWDHFVAAYGRVLRNLGKEASAPGSGVWGVTDQLTSRAYLREIQPGYSKIEYAVHEALHLLEKTATGKPASAFQYTYGVVLEEAATQYFTLGILRAHGFGGFSTSHEKLLPLAQELVKALDRAGLKGEQCLAGTLFLGKIDLWTGLKKIFGEDAMSFRDALEAAKVDDVDRLVRRLKAR
jgi:hypothetical protein